MFHGCLKFLSFKGTALSSDCLQLILSKLDSFVSGYTRPVPQTDGQCRVLELVVCNICCLQSYLFFKNMPYMCLILQHLQDCSATSEMRAQMLSLGQQLGIEVKFGKMVWSQSKFCMKS